MSRKYPDTLSGWLLYLACLAVVGAVAFGISRGLAELEEPRAVWLWCDMFGVESACSEGE